MASDVVGSTEMPDQQLIEVELPDGSIAEFPPGTSHEVMKGAIRRQLQKQQAQDELNRRRAARGESAYGPGAQMREKPPITKEQAQAELDRRKSHRLALRGENSASRDQDGWSAAAEADRIETGVPPSTFRDMTESGAEIMFEAGQRLLTMAGEAYSQLLADLLSDAIKH